MFKPDTLATLVVIFLLALIVGQPVLAWLLGMLLVTLLVADRWSKLGVRRLRFERRFSQSHAFIGDSVTLTTRVVNPKLLSVPGLECLDQAPDRFEFMVDVQPSLKPNSVVLQRSIALRPYEAVSWDVTLRCKARGLHLFGPVELTATDPFGFYSTAVRDEARSALVVYPELVSLPGFSLTPRHPTGDRKAPRQLLPDPIRTAGVRDYRPSDPFKTIHWGATARRGELQTRVFEPSSMLEVAIVLDLDTFEHYWEGVRPDLIEYLISVAATVATAADRDRWSIGLYANAGTFDSDELISIPTSRSPAQIGVILEALARLVPYSVVGLPYLLRRRGHELPWRSTVVVISAVPSMEVQAALLRLAEHGRRIRWLYGGEGPVPQVPGVDVEALPFDARWHERTIGEIRAR